MSKPLLIDFHNHFDFLPNWINTLTNTFLKNENSINFLLEELGKRNQKIIIGYALYALPWIKKEYKEIQRQIKVLNDYEQSNKKQEIKIIKRKQDLHGDYKIGIILHLESVRWLHGDLSIINELYHQGVHGLIPIHYKNNWVGGSCDDLTAKVTFNRYQKDITESGKRLLDKMDQLNMWLDLSHMNDKSLMTSLNYFNGPIAASHIGLRDIINVDRNLSQKSIQAIKDKEGLIGICAWSRITGKSDKELKSMIDILLSLDMEDNVVIGSDFGPPIHTAKGNKNIFDFYEILKNSVDNEIISDKIMYNNAFNFIENFLPD